MFDMNMLWEKFVYVSLRKGLRNNAGDCAIHQQPHKLFWRADSGRQTRIEPDILIKHGDVSYILDTKWKIMKDGKPSVEDLRQMYVYHDYYTASKTALVYPGETHQKTGGNYIHRDTKQLTDKECSILQLTTEKNLTEWQKSIYREFESWVGTSKMRDNV